jgi:hypothetical protein
MTPWLIDERKPLQAADMRELEREVTRTLGGARRGSVAEPTIAVRLRGMVIHDTKKWFGEADIRLDALVVHGPPLDGQGVPPYAPRTFAFPRVRDGDRLPTGENGLLIFYGKARYFLDMSLTVSRNRSDSEELSTLLTNHLKGGETKTAVASLLALSVAAPPVAAITTAMHAAGVLGSLAYDVLSKSAGPTIGLYRDSWLQYRDEFGIGRHPEQGVYRANDLSFSYEIVYEDPMQPNNPS